MQAAIEQGLGAQRTKLGPGEKEEGYLLRASRAKAFVSGVLATLVVLVILVGSYAALFNDERMRRMFQLRKQMVDTGNAKEDIVRLGLAIHQQEASREEQERDTVRSFKRITSVLERKFDLLLSDVTVTPEVKAALMNAKRDVTEYVAEELRDFEKERAQYDKESGKRLERLAKMQEQSMRELLKTVSGVKMEALMSMLEEVFQAAEKAPDVRVDLSVVEQLQELADALYEERTTLQEGRDEFNRLRTRVSGTIPTEITSQMSQATNADDFAAGLDSLCEIARLSAGRGDIAAIEKQWRAALLKAEQNAEKNEERANKLMEKGIDPEDEFDDYDEEVQANVDAVLAVHKLVSEGKVPLHLLDFEAMELEDTDEDGVPDELEDEAHRETERQAASSKKKD